MAKAFVKSPLVYALAPVLSNAGNPEYIFMQGNGAEKLREETGHSACAFQRTPEAFSGHIEWLEIICRDCGEKVSRSVSSIASRESFVLYEDEDLYDPTVQELLREMRKSFCKEIDWNRIWF